MLMDDKKRRALELANRLPDMTNAEWSLLKRLIDARFQEKVRQAGLAIQLCEIRDEDFCC